LEQLDTPPDMLPIELVRSPRLPELGLTFSVCVSPGV